MTIPESSANGDIQGLLLEHSSSVPEPVAPYSHATVWGGLVFVTGQLPVDPTTNNLVGGNMAAQAEQVRANLEAVLVGAGSRMANALSVRVFLTSMESYEEFNRAYRSWFTERLPSRTCVGVCGLALGAKVEVDMVAALIPAQARLDGGHHRG